MEQWGIGKGYGILKIFIKTGIGLQQTEFNIHFFPIFMIISQALVLIFLLLIVAIIMSFFYRENKKTRQNHSEIIVILKSAINLHQSQIHFRNAGLQKYDFTKYNLSEALILQPEIIT